MKQTKSKILTILVSFLLLFNLQLKAQEIFLDKETSTKENQNIINQTEENTEDNALFKKTIRYTVLIGAPLSTFLFGLEAWDWGDQKSPRVAYENWFAHDAYEGGADKPGHLFAHYLVMRASYNIFNYTETNEKKKWLYSLGTSLLIGTMIEVGDAFTGEYGFSFEDLLADSLGIAIGALLEKYPIADGFVGLSIEYERTPGFKKKYNNAEQFVHFAADYSGLKFLVNLKFAGFKNIGVDIPDFLRYIMVDVGYYARGYTSYDREYYNDKKRYLYFGISINFAEVVKDFFDNKDRTLCRVLQQPFNYYHVPINMEHPYSLDN